MAFTPEDNSMMNYTVDARRLFGETHGNRRILGRDEDPRGKVLYTAARGEAIVVDPDKYPAQYEKWYSELENRASDGSNRVQRSKVLGSAFSLVSEKMKYSQEGVDTILRENGAVNDGDKIELSVFMEDGVGVCRHQALVVATLLNQAKDAGHIRGDISVDKSEQWSPDGDRGGHAWVRYTSYGGDVMILDVAQGFAGTLEESRQRQEGWNYLRPEDKMAVEAQQIGGTAVNQIIDRVPDFASS